MLGTYLNLLHVSGNLSVSITDHNVQTHTENQSNKIKLTGGARTRIVTIPNACIIFNNITYFTIIFVDQMSWSNKLHGQRSRVRLRIFFYLNFLT